IGDLASDGNQLRPAIVWFGEMVPMMDNAIDEVLQANILIVIGTSLQVYPAASLLDYTLSKTKIICVDPNDLPINNKIIHIKKNATEGIEDLKNYLNNL
ncbi:MAG: Sir2 family NAD-dependent protein deacetylase, partial [Bacilli bacterium]